VPQPLAHTAKSESARCCFSRRFVPFAPEPIALGQTGLIGEPVIYWPAVKRDLSAEDK
jgi:hypothetical protein